RVLSRLAHRGDERAIAPPQPHLVAVAREVNRERGAPASAAEHADAGHAGSPRRRSVRLSSRRRLPRWRNVITAATAAAPPVIGGVPPVASTSGGSASAAMSEPSDTYRVAQSPTVKIAAAATVASGARTPNAPQVTATPLPPRKRSHTG